MRAWLGFATVFAALLAFSLLAPSGAAAQQLDERVITFTTVGEVDGYTNATLDAEESAAARLLADVDGDGNVSADEVATFNANLLRRVIEQPGEAAERLDGAPPQGVQFLSLEVGGLEGPVDATTRVTRSTHYTLTFTPVAQGDRHTFTRVVDNETGARWRLTAPPGFVITHVGGFRQIFLTATNEASGQAGTHNITFTFALPGAAPPPIPPPAPTSGAVAFSHEAALGPRGVPPATTRWA